MKKQLLILSIRTYFNTMVWISPSKVGREGFYLFCRPRRRPVKPHHVEFFNTSEKFQIEYDGKKIQGYRWGTGDKKLLLLHGWESHSYWWRSIVNTLSKEKYTFYSIDAPGHGLSEGSYNNLPYYSGLIEKVILEHGDFHAILGHSLGAFATAFTLHRAPHLGVSRFVAMAAPGEASEFVAFYKNAVGFSKRTMRAIEKYFVKKLGNGPEYFSLKQFTKTLKLPGLMIHDTKDPDAPYKHALAAHQNWKSSQMITTTGLGHNLKSTELIKNVEDFLSQEVFQPQTLA
jgi:pimeloyl-ACP methyl ester carboxylesterase